LYWGPQYDLSNEFHFGLSFKEVVRKKIQISLKSNAFAVALLNTFTVYGCLVLHDVSFGIYRDVRPISFEM